MAHPVLDDPQVAARVRTLAARVRRVAAQIAGGATTGPLYPVVRDLLADTTELAALIPPDPGVRICAGPGCFNVIPPGSRSDRLYCDGACQVAASRARRRAATAVG